MHARRPPEIIDDLHLVPASQSNAAVAFLRDVVLNVQFEIPEFVFGDDVVRVTGTRQNAIRHGPALSLLGLEAGPTGEVFSVEQSDRLSFDP